MTEFNHELPEIEVVKKDLRTDPDVTAFLNMTPARIATWIDNNVEADPSTVRLLKVLAKSFLMMKEEIK